MSVIPVTQNSLSPFAPRDPEHESWLVEELIKGMTDLDIEGDVYALESCTAFRGEMLADIDPDMKAAKVLKKLLGRGVWSKWPWTVRQVVDGLVARVETRRILASLNPDALCVYGELGELHHKLKPFRPS